MNPAIRDYMAAQGRKGGAAKSPAKVQAVRANLQRAHAALKLKRLIAKSAKVFGCLAIALLPHKGIAAHPGAQDAPKAIYGEACGEPFKGKLALASAIRNRLARYGDLRGVYGVNSPLLAHKLNAKAWNECALAWSMSATNDFSHGATHWGSDSDLAHNRFYSKLEKLGKIGGHSFFRESK